MPTTRFVLGLLVILTGVGLSASTALGQFDYYAYGPRYQLELDQRVTPDYSPIIVLPPNELRAFQATLRALQQPYRGAFFEAELTTCMDRLQRDLGVSISLDERALADASIGTDTLITKDMPGVTARVFLDAMLADQGMAWVPKHEGILITTIEERDSNSACFLRVVYPVNDLVTMRVGDEDEYDLDTLIDLIYTTVHPESWDVQGGNGVIAPYPGIAAIVVESTLEIQEEILAMLEALRQAKRQQGIGTVRLRLPPDAVQRSPRAPSIPQPRQRERQRWSTKEATPNNQKGNQPTSGGVF